MLMENYLVIIVKITKFKNSKAIFHEKETLIENCLFGVDINLTQ